jgi:ribosomal 50S subunit-recycling heat shock protein
VSSKIVKRRTLAKSLCDNGSIRVNNIKAKASRNINTNDYITVELKGRKRTFIVISIPEKKHPRLLQEEIVKLISEENISNESYQTY